MTSSNLPPPLPGQSGRSPVVVVSLGVAGALALGLLVLVSVAIAVRGTGDGGVVEVEGETTEAPPSIAIGSSSGGGPSAAGAVGPSATVVGKTAAPPNAKTPGVVPGKGREPLEKGQQASIGRDPFADIKARGNTLELPESHQADLLARTIGFKMLATLYTADLDGCRLRLLPGLDSPNGATFRLVKEMSEDASRRVWSVRRTAVTGAGVGDKERAESKSATVELREVEVDDEPVRVEQRLFVAWDKRAQSNWAQELGGMQLEVSVGRRSEICSFKPVAGFAPVEIKFERQRELGPDLSSLEVQLKRLDQDTLFVDLDPRGFPPTARLNVRGANVQADDTPLADAGRLLRQIRLADLLVRGGRRYSIVIPSEVDGGPDVVSIRLGFHPPGNAGHIGLSVTWECLVLEQIKTKIVMDSRAGLSLREAEQSPMRLGAFKKRSQRQGVALKDEIVRLIRKRLGLLRTYNRTCDRRVRIRMEKEIRKTSAKLNRAKDDLKEVQAGIRSAERYANVPDSVTRAMKTVHGKSTIGWRLYCKRAGREINVATGE